MAGCVAGTDAELGGVSAALLALCCDGPPAGSKAAPCALVALAGREEAATQLEPIARQLVSRLVRTGGSSEAKLPVTMAALSSIGRCLPKAWHCCCFCLLFLQAKLNHQILMLLQHLPCAITDSSTKNGYASHI